MPEGNSVQCLCPVGFSGILCEGECVGFLNITGFQNPVKFGLVVNGVFN